MVNERTNETSSCERNFFFPCTPCPRKLRSYRQVDLELSKKVLILEVGGLLSKYWGSQSSGTLGWLHKNNTQHAPSVTTVLVACTLRLLLVYVWLHARCVCYYVFGCMRVASITTFLVACNAIARDCSPASAISHSLTSSPLSKVYTSDCVRCNSVNGIQVARCMLRWHGSSRTTQQVNSTKASHLRALKASHRRAPSSWRSTPHWWTYLQLY